MVLRNEKEMCHIVRTMCPQITQLIVACSYYMPVNYKPAQK